MPRAIDDPNNNALRAWFARFPRPMFRADFAKLAGISHSYLSQLCSDNPPWPSRDVLLKIITLTKGEVTADDFLKMPNADRVKKRAA